MKLICDFFVEGEAKPQGSKSLVKLRNGKTVIINACKKTKQWRNIVSKMAMLNAPEETIDEPVYIETIFYMKRPKSHYTSNKPERGLKKNVPVYHTSTPDLIKLVRAVEDSLSGIIFTDDRKVVKHSAVKLYANEKIGVHIKVYVIGDKNDKNS